MIDYDVTIKITDGVLKLIKKSSEIIMKESQGRLIINGMKDTFYCIILNDGEFYAKENLSIVVSKNDVDLSFLEVNDILRISKYILSIEKGNSKETITLLTSTVKEYSGDVKQYSFGKKYDNKLLLACLRAVNNNIPGTIDNVRFNGTDIYISSLFTMIKIENNSWSANLSVPFKLLLAGLSDGSVNNDNSGNTVISNTDIVNYFSAIQTTDILEPKDEFKSLYSTIEFSSDNKNILTLLQLTDFNETRLIISGNRVDVQLKSDNLVVNPEAMYEKTIMVSSTQISSIIKLFNKEKFNIDINSNGNLLRFWSTNKSSKVNLYCAGKVV